MGGGIDNNTGLLTVVNCTLTNDSAVSGGGGGMLNTGTATLDNTIVAGNAASNGDNDIQGALAAAGSNNLIGDGTGMTGISNGSNGNQVGSEATPINPLLGPLANNGGPTETVALLPDSPAIDHGSNALIPAGVTTDQRGYIRIVNAVVDIGAYEFGAAPLGTPLIVNSTQDDVDFSSAAALTLRQAVSLADATTGGASITFSSALLGQTTTLTEGSLKLSDASGTTTIEGPGANLLTISANGAGAIFDELPGATAAMSGITLTEAKYSAIQEISSTLTLTEMIIFDSSGGSGGGIYNTGASPSPTAPLATIRRSLPAVEPSTAAASTTSARSPSPTARFPATTRRATAAASSMASAARPSSPTAPFPATGRVLAAAASATKARSRSLTARFPRIRPSGAVGASISPKARSCSTTRSSR